jgi:DNA-binding MarR family transcriptional regulator
MSIEEQIKTNQISEYKKALINIIYTGNYINDEIACVLKPFDISIQQFNVLRILKGQKGKPANLSTIQERMVSKMSNTTRIVDKLIDKKFVSRSICKHNRRKVEIVITEEGKSFLNRVNTAVESKETELTSILKTKELKTINQLLDQIRES